MDLALYSRVLWRFRILIAAGLTLAFSLAFVSYARVTFDGLSPQVTYRHQETWQSTMRLFVTQEGFPWGRTIFRGEPREDGQYAPPFADQGRLTGLAIIYANLASSDAIYRMIDPALQIEGGIDAIAATAPNNPQITLPIVAIFGTARTPEGAQRLTERAGEALREYVRRGQEASATPVAERVVLQPLTAPRGATLVEGRKRTVPITVFLAVLVAAVALAFVLENLRPRIRPLRELHDVNEESGLSARRTG